MTKRLLLGTRKGLLILQQVGAAWEFERECFRAQTVTYAMRDPRTGTLWAALDHGHWGPKLQRSDDCGATWQEVPTPRYPAGLEVTLPTPEGSRVQPAALRYPWIIQPGGADQPNRLYIGSEPSGLFYSDDGGETFHFNHALWERPERTGWWYGGGRDLPGVCSICVDPRDSRHVIIGISVGGVYETLDDGQTWAARNQGLYANYLPDPYSEFGHDPHFMLMSPSNPDVLWQQNHCGIFRSTNSAQSWVDISKKDTPAYFGFAIAVDPHDAQTAWVVPAVDAEYRLAVANALCVCRTSDGGQTWQELRAGLPQQHTYDVTLRHALDLHGDQLAFGTTTGNLYTSADRGDAWTAYSHNLPPIYSVRFAGA